MDILFALVGLVLMVFVFRLLFATGKVVWRYLIPALMALVLGLILAALGSFFGPIGALIGFIAGLASGWEHGMRWKARRAPAYSNSAESSSGGSSSSGSSSVSAKDNPQLTRYRQRTCHQCGTSCQHEIARIAPGHNMAYATCRKCGHFQEEPW